MNSKLGPFIFAIAAAAIPASFAQASDFVPQLKVGGQIFANYEYALHDVGEDPNNKFAIDRVYLTLKAKMTPSFSARVTTDVGAIKGHDADQKLRNFLKHAYLEYTNRELGMKVRFGAAGTGFIGKHDKFVGMRWVSKAFTDDYKILSSSDLGIHVMGAHLDGMLDYQVSIMNGSGYGKRENDDGKAAQIRVSVDPLAGGEMSLPISAFISYDIGGQGVATMVAAGSVGLELGLGKAWAEVVSTSFNNVNGLGFSATLLPNIPVLGKLFVKMDQMDPNTDLDGDAATHIMGGLTHDFAKLISAGLIYEREMPENGPISHSVYLKTQAGF